VHQSFSWMSIPRLEQSACGAYLFSTTLALSFAVGELPHRSRESVVVGNRVQIHVFEGLCDNGAGLGVVPRLKERNILTGVDVDLDIDRRGKIELGV